MLLNALDQKVAHISHTNPVYVHSMLYMTNHLTIGPEMVKIKVGISFKRLQCIFFHSYVSSIAPKMTF